MPQNIFFHELVIFWSGKKNDAKTLFSTLHPLSLVIFATATVLAFVLLRNFRFNSQCYTQCEATPTQKLARGWCRDLSLLLVQKITKGIHSCRPASLNCPNAHKHVIIINMHKQVTMIIAQKCKIMIIVHKHIIVIIAHKHINQDYCTKLY